MLNKAHKIKLNPTNSQKAFFEKSFGEIFSNMVERVE